MGQCGGMVQYVGMGTKGKMEGLKISQISNYRDHFYGFQAVIYTYLKTLDYSLNEKSKRKNKEEA